MREAEQRAAALSRVDRWWVDFENAAGEIAAASAERARFDIAGFMKEHLQRIDERLMWEFGPGIGTGGQRLVITPESERELRPLVDVILSRAPSIPSWEFYPYRMPGSFEEAVLLTRGRTGIDVSPFHVETSRGAHHRIDLRWLVPPGAKPDDASLGAAFVASEALLGEEILDTWIGDIRVLERPRPGLFGRMLGRPDPTPGSEVAPASLKNRVESLVAAVDRDLPGVPHAGLENYEAKLFKLKPAEAADYPGQADLFVGGSRGLPEMWLAAHSSAPFSSRRYSKHGEIFCYLKMDGSQGGLTGSSYRARSEIEDAIDDRLRRGALGSVVGGGTGKRYSYIDLALLHVDEGLAEVRALMREGGIPRRSWLLFFDAQWRDEWVGVYDDTPAPPQLPDRTEVTSPPS